MSWPDTARIAARPSDTPVHRLSIAHVLTGAWRCSPPSFELSAVAIQEIAPLLLAAGTGALGWWRVRHSELSASRMANQLLQAYRYHTLQAAISERELTRLVAHLRDAGVEPLLGKGWAAARCYAEPGLRPYGDFDFCIRPEQYARAKAAGHSIEQVTRMVDLHPGLARQQKGQAFSLLDDRTLDDLFDRSRLVRVGDGEVRILGPEDHLRLLCLHMLNHGASRPLWLCDIGAAVETRPADFDWDWFLRGDPRRTRWVIGSIGLAHRLLGAIIEDTPVYDQALQLPDWMVPTVLLQWSQVFRPRTPLAGFFRHPAGFWQELRRHWPNGIEATLNVGGALNDWPRWPFQVGALCSRAAGFVGDLPGLRRPN
jgi:hypothetical protein